MNREIDSHLVLLQDDFERRGLPPDEARRASRRVLGSVEQTRELHREARSFIWMEQCFRDLRYGARNLLHAPGFTAVAVLTLALGIGANTAIFSVVNAVLLRPLAYRDPDRLVTLLHDGVDPVAPANYTDWRDQSHCFEAMAAAEYWSPNLTGIDPPEHLIGIRFAQNLLPMLGIQPLVGRWFVPGEDRKGAEHEVILSYRLWRRRFNADRTVVGKPIILSGQSYLVVGVMPSEFQFAPFWATRAELWAPLALEDRSRDRDNNSLRIFARLRKGVSLAQARSEVAGITARLERQYPGTNRNVLLRPLKENVVGRVETPLLMMLGAVGFVLLIACANVAHMLLARTSDRQREIAVRVALGAGRMRVVCQFLVENLLLAFFSAIGGLVLTVWGVRALITITPPNIPRMETLAMDARVAMFLFVITLVTAVASGLAPAMYAAGANLTGALKEAGRGGTDGIRRNRVRSFLVASELALAFMLLIGSGLMIRSFVALRSVDPGFDPHNVLSMVVSVAGSKEAEPHRRELFYRQLLDEVRSLRGVVSAGGINHLPLAGDQWGHTFFIEGRPKPRPGEEPVAVYRVITPGYFQAMGIRLLRGRDIKPSDDMRQPGVVIINERAAAVYWPGENPVGKRLMIDGDKFWLKVIGVVHDVTQSYWAVKPDPEIYLAALQNDDFLESAEAHYQYVTLVVHTRRDPAALAPAVKQTIWSLDHNLAVFDVLTMARVVADANAQPRFEMFLFALFGAVALLLAASGIYAVFNYAVARRTHEIGIRISLGASRAQVLRMVLQQVSAQMLAGFVAGIAGALLLARLMGGMLYGVHPADPLTYTGAAGVIGITALLAICVPGCRAVCIEPMIALRNE